MNSQLTFIKNTLIETGEVSRNQCLKVFISRLEARIRDCKKEGWQFETETRPTIKPDGSKGRDFVYKLISRPLL